MKKFKDKCIPFCFKKFKIITSLEKLKLKIVFDYLYQNK
jgi:hypothetical protein